ncbi:MAG: hypothetical protein R2857_15000 [Vampirovibrionales bacterium]
MADAVFTVGKQVDGKEPVFKAGRGLGGKWYRLAGTGYERQGRRHISLAVFAAIVFKVFSQLGHWSKHPYRCQFSGNSVQTSVIVGVFLVKLFNSKLLAHIRVSPSIQQVVAV